MPKSLSLALVLLTSIMLLPAPGSTALAAEENSDDDAVQWAFSGEARFRPEYRDDADLDAAEDDESRLGFMRLRLGIEATIQKMYRVFIQAQDARVAGDEESTASNEKNLDLHQGYLDITTHPGSTLLIRLGRQELNYGDQRMLGGFWWNNIGRSFDGVKVRYERDRMAIDGFVTEVAKTVDAAVPSGFPGRTITSNLYGVYAQFAHREGAQYEGYWLEFDDNDQTMGETGAFGDSRIDAFGIRVKEKVGPVDFTVEAVAETGHSSGDDLSAHAAGVVAGYTFGGASKIRLFGGYDLATGDEDSTDGETEQFFNFFPTNHLHYGYADFEGWRNIESYYCGATLSRGRHFALVRAHRFSLEDSHGPWQNAGGTVLGADPTGAAGTSVGKEIDLVYRFTLREKASLEGGYSRFSPGRFAETTRGGDDSDWAYLMVRFGF